MNMTSAKSDVPLVCICIPCYNNEATIVDTLQSIMNQTYANIIIKVFDNASTDKTLEKVQSFLGKVYPLKIYTRSSTVSGEENISTCISNAEGIYTAIFHSDDVYLPEMIKEQVFFLENNDTCKAVAMHACEIDGSGNKIGFRFVPPELKQAYSHVLKQSQLIELSFKYGNFITCPSVLFSTDILVHHIKFFNGDNFKSSADLNVWFRLTEKGDMGFINNALMSYRLSKASFSYNLARVRIDDHDLFLALNQALLNYNFSPKIDKKLVRYRDFLLMKDRANTNLNRLILNKPNFQPIDLFQNIKFIFESKFHMKYFVISSMVKLFLILPKAEWMSKLVKQVKFRND